jgi:hypothetical protein
MSNTYKYKYEKYKEKYFNLKNNINNQNGGYLKNAVYTSIYTQKDLDKMDSIIKSIQEKISTNETISSYFNNSVAEMNKKDFVNIHILNLYLNMLTKYKKEDPVKIFLLTNRYIGIIENIYEEKNNNSDKYSSKFIDIALLFDKTSSNTLDELDIFINKLFTLLVDNIYALHSSVNNDSKSLILLEFLSKDRINKIQLLKAKIEPTTLINLIEQALIKNYSSENQNENFDLLLSLLLEILKEQPGIDFNTLLGRLKDFNKFVGPINYYENYKDLLKRVLKGDTVDLSKELKISKYAKSILDQHTQAINERKLLQYKLESQISKAKAGKLPSISFEDPIETIRYKLTLPINDHPEYKSVTTFVGKLKQY